MLQFKKFLLKKEFDLVGIQAFSSDVNITKKMVNAVKSIKPNILVGIGGPHPSGLGKEIFKEIPQIDFAFRGEAEIGLPQYVEGNISHKEIRGLITKEVDNPAIFWEKIDDFGMPAWDLIPPDKYPPAPPNLYFKKYPFAPIITTRGCPFSCTFCEARLIAGRKLRFRSIEFIMEEIKLLYEKYKIREFFIIDDNFTFDKEHVVNFCEEVNKSNMKFFWSPWNGVRLDTLDEELLRMMKKSGCYMIKVGIESGSERILKKIKKGLKKEVIKEKIDIIRKVDLDVFGFFIIGFPGETEEDLKQTYEFSQELNLTGINIANYQPLPGTDLYNELIKSGEFKPSDWKEDESTFADVIFTPKGFTKKDIKKWQKKLLMSFYLRPKIFLHNLYRVIQSRNYKHIFYKLWAYLFRY